MNNINFVKDIKNFNISYPENTILVYHHDYEPPNYKDVRYFKLSEYLTKYSDIDTDCIILVGLNKIVNPSNRCNFVNEYLSTLSTHLMKFSIDNIPFIGEPWRIFFHYLYTNNNKFNVPHSYALETEWKHWFLRETNECRISGENIGKLLVNTYSDISPLTTSFEFKTVGSSDYEAYDKIREYVFDKYNTPKLFINNILKQTNKHFNISLDFDSYLENKSIVLPDLKIYRFMAEENNRRLKIYNQAVKQNENI